MPRPPPRGAVLQPRAVRERLSFVLVAVLPLALSAACGSDTDIPGYCNPLGGQGCLRPWPSAVYEVADPTTATGRRLQLPIEAMPRNLDDSPVDPEAFNRWDGFSPTGPMLAQFPAGVSNVNLLSWKDPDASLAADSPIVVVNAATGERVPFFAEVDQNTKDVVKRDLIIRPLVRLDPGAHYVVGIRRSVKAADGGELPLSPAFAAALGGDDFDHPRFQRERFPAMFAALAAAGVDRTDLVLAWDFHTASDEFLRRDLTTMRDAALPMIGTNGANLSFTATAQTPATGILRSFVGTFESPDFLTLGEADASILRRDAAGLPQASGLRDASFAALVPQCVTTEPLPRPTILFGHGLFGLAKEYLDDKFVRDLAQRYCFVIIAGNFIGLTSQQLHLAPLAVNDMNRGAQITEKLAQAVIDFMALGALARGPMAQAPEFMVDGTSVLDPARTFYVGGSLGGIMGNTLMAYDPHISKAVLAVPGGVWSMMFERSTAWHLLMGAAMGAYPDPELYQLNIALLGMGMEPYDPITTAAHVIRDPLPGVPAKNVLLWYAVGDALVTNIATEMVARTMGLDLLGPAVHPVWRMPPKAGPLASGLNLYDEKPTPMPSELNIPPTSDNGTHSDVNKRAAALRQVERFLLGGEVGQECRDGDGEPVACDCSTGACD
jgi:hypothetical protein